MLTIATGMAALVLCFGVVNAALFRQPPFAEAERLAMLFLERNPRGEAPRRERWSFGRYELLAGAQHGFETLASYSPTTLTLSDTAQAELVRGERVSASYFRTLRVAVERGRVFTAREDDPGKPAAVAVISHNLWMRRWFGEAGVIGRIVRLNGVPLTVIGVLPPGFAGLSGRSDVWIPRSMSPRVTYPEYLTTNQNFIIAIGRLRPGVTLRDARAELAVLGAQINRALPSDPDYPEERVSATALTLNELRADRNTRRSLFILLAAVAVLHLLACANVANLLLGRAAGKRRDLAVQLAIGSSHGRLFGQMFVEAGVLVLFGGVLGILAAWAASSGATPPTDLWARSFSGSLAPFDTPDFSVVESAFGAAAVLLTSILVALPLSMAALHVDVASGLRAGSRALAGVGLSFRRPSVRGAIVALEAGLATVLVVAAALLIASFQRMRDVQAGVRAQGILTFWITTPEARVPPAAAPAFISRALEAVSSVPGVQSATVDGGAPLNGSATGALRIVGKPAPLPGQAPEVDRHYVGPDHFRTLEIPVLRGRVFAASDVAGSPRVAVISASAARRFWPSQDPIGQRVWFESGSNFNSPDSSAEIVGIVGDVIYEPLDQTPNLASFYTPYTQFTYATRMFFVRTAGDPMSILPGLRKAIARVDADLAPSEVQPLTNVMSGSWARTRFDAALFGGFGIAALMLAASGIFAVVAHAVAARTREFGIRIALGAQVSRVMLQVLGEGILLPAAGLAAGTLAAIAATKALRSVLYEVSPTDPRVFLGAVVVLLVTASLACLVPAWRAAHADPVQSLRSE